MHLYTHTHTFYLKRIMGMALDFSSQACSLGKTSSRERRGYPLHDLCH